MKKQTLRRHLLQLITGKKEAEKAIIFYYLNPVTEKRELLHREPDKMDLEIEVDSPATVESFLNLRKPEQKNSVKSNGKVGNEISEGTIRQTRKD